MKDEVFYKPKKFEFDSEVASVFDDMLSRSIPFYHECQDLITKLILKNTKYNDIILDIGCSTGNTLINIFQQSNKKLNLIGIDSSEPMIHRAIRKANAYGVECDFLYQDCLDYDLGKTDFVIANYTMQFIELSKRKILLKNIAKSLNHNGSFIMSEKIVYKDNLLNKNIIDIYHEFKQQNGYSQMEIANKKEALENVLIPLNIKQNIDMLTQSGFKRVDTIFQFGNFVVFLCKK